MPPVLKMAWRNALKNWRHSLAALLSIAAGFVALSMFEGYMAGVRRLFEDGFAHRLMFGHLIVDRRGAEASSWANSLDFALGAREQAFLERFLASHAADVKERVRFLELSGMATDGRTHAIFVGFGYDVPEGARVRGPVWGWNTSSGVPLYLAGPGHVNLAGGLGLALDCAAAPGHPWLDAEAHPIPAERPFHCRRDRIQLSATTASGQLNAVEPRVAGLVEGGMKELYLRFVGMPLDLAQRLLDTDKVSLVSIELRRPERADAFMAELRRAAATEGVPVEVRRSTDHRLGEFSRRGLELIGIFRTFVTIVVLVVAGMSVLNTLRKSVAERTREIGTLRSLGFLRRHVVLLFAIEASILSLLASLTGLAATLALSAAVNAAGIRYQAGYMAEKVPLRIAPVPGVWLAAAAFLGLVALIAAALPARRASRMRIPEALAHA